MKIRRLSLKGFGCLRGEFHFSADRVNLLLEPNEKGKSTLAAAILAGLYGFPAGRNRSEGRRTGDQEIHRPWTGDGYALEMDVEAGGDVYTIRRDFGRREESVIEWQSGKEITGDFLDGDERLDFGARLTGLSREEFARTAFVRQGAIHAIRNPGGLTAALQKTATSHQGDVAASEAIATLRASLRKFTGRKIRIGKVDMELAEIDDEIASLSSRLESLDARRRKAEERIRDLEETSREEGRNEAELKRLEHLILLAGHQEDSRALEQETEERRDLDKLEGEFQQLQSFAEFPSDKRARLMELKGWLTALAEEEIRLRSRIREEVTTPKERLDRGAEGESGTGAPTGELLAGIESAEMNLMAAWKVRRDARRSRRRSEATWAEQGLDPERLRKNSAQFGSLSADEKRFLRDYPAREMELKAQVAEEERDREDRERGAEDVAAVEETGTPPAPASESRKNRGLLGAALGLAGLWQQRRPRPSGSSGEDSPDPEIEATKETASVPEQPVHETESRRKSADLEALRAELASLAAKLEIESAEELLERFRESESHADEAAELGSLQRQGEEARRSLEEAITAVRARMAELGHEPRFGAVTPGTTRRFRRAMEARDELRKELAEISEREQYLHDEIEKLEGERKESLEEVRAILEEAGLPTNEDIEKSAALFEQGIKNRDRYETLKKEIIPGLVRRSLNHRGESLKKAVEIASAIIARKNRENPELVDLVPERSHKEYLEERDALRQTAKSLVEKRMELSAELGEVLREYRKDYPDAQRWLREWKAQRARTSMFKSAVQIASEVLEELSREAYSEWADILNERATEALAAIAPGYGNIRFDEDLSFTLRQSGVDHPRNREDVERRFSRGTRDQVYLAVRLALAGYLSSGKIKLPLILDDPFANFDDERFSRAMSLLMEKFARRHQILIFSSQETRHRYWQDRNAGRSAERVRLMTLQALAT